MIIVKIFGAYNEIISLVIENDVVKTRENSKKGRTEA